MSVALSDSAVQEDLRVLVASEAGGVPLFAAAARFAWNARERTMWETLHALEVHTRALVWDLLGDRMDRFSATEKTAGVGGTTAGLGLMALPRPMQMRSLTMSTWAFLPHFVRLRDHFAGTPEAGVFEFVVAHEMAIAEVGLRGVAGDAGLLEPVEKLLNS